MAGRYQAYPEYKDSGVEWLGEVPKHWLVKKLKYICDVQTGTKDTVNDIDDGQYPFFVRSQTVERINSIGADCEAVLTAGDGVGVGKVFHYYNGKFDFHQRVYMLNKFAGVMGKFVYYYLLINFYKVALEGTAKSTVDSLRLPQFLNFEFSLPDRDTQAKILHFLDHETAKIDNLIEKQQQLIKLLKEKRQAVISHAVTKGLNPDAPMRDSSVEWLGEVPEHWLLVQLKRVVELQRGYDLPSDLRVEGEYPIVSSGGIISSHHESRSTGPGIVTGRYGTIGEFYFVEGDYWPLNTSLYSVDTHGNVVKFLWYMLQKMKHLFVLNSLKSAVPGVDRNDLHPERISIPFDLSEQQAIVQYLDDELKKIAYIESKASEQIELLRERRTALISSAVTGKIDVRNWKAPEQKQTNKEDAA